MDIQDQRILTAFCSLSAHALMNGLALEEVIFGHLHPKEPVPFQKFLKVLSLETLQAFIARKAISGDIITEDGCIIDGSSDSFLWTFYNEQAEQIFAKASCSHLMAILPAYKRKLSEYLKELFPLFCGVMQTEIPDPIQLDFFREPVDLRSLSDLRDFLSVILLKGLRQGKRVDRYLKSLLPLTGYLRRLIRERNGHFYLENSDIQSLDYRLTLLSCFSFLSPENNHIFALKLHLWETKQEGERHRFALTSDLPFGASW